MTSERDFHAQLETSLGLSFYGCNLDALWDTLSASVERPLRLVWKDSLISRNMLGERFDLIVEVLDAVTKQDEGFEWDERFTYLLD